MIAQRPRLEFARLTDATLIAVALTYGLLLELAGVAGLLGLPLLVLVSLSLWRYCYEVLKRVAQGRSTFAPPGMESMNPFGDFALVLHFGLFAALMLLLGNPAVFGDGAAAALLRWTGYAAVAAAFPASAALMALTHDVGAAVSPKRVAVLMQVLGRGYVQLLAFSAAVLSAVAAVRALPLPFPVRPLLAAAVEIWSLLAVFCLIGSAVRARRDVLEIPGEREPESERRRREMQEDWRKQLDLAYASIRSGLTEQGYGTILRLVAGADSAAEVHEWVLDEMREWEDKSHAAAFAAHVIGWLLEHGERYRALEVFARSRRLPGGIALDAGAADRLAEYARSVGQQGLAEELIERAGPMDAFPLKGDPT